MPVPCMSGVGVQATSRSGSARDSRTRSASSADDRGAGTPNFAKPLGTQLTANTVDWRDSTPLGRPVVPPV